jgi:hypothetical protein
VAVVRAAAAGAGVVVRATGAAAGAERTTGAGAGADRTTGAGRDVVEEEVEVDDEDDDEEVGFFCSAKAPCSEVAANSDNIPSKAAVRSSVMAGPQARESRGES